MSFSQILLASIPLVALALAHPGEVHSHEKVLAELLQRTNHAQHISRGLAACSGNPNFEAMEARASERLQKRATELRTEAGIPLHLPFKRDLAALETFEGESHNLSSAGFTSSTRRKKLFANYKNTSCILTPEVTEGPYWVTGEKLRTNVREDQAGIPVHLEYQFIDTSTCDAVPNVYVDTWQANATGVYSGIVASGNGNVDDKTNINTTFLRGMAKTGLHGHVAFDTVFAGHYEGRATHIHLIAQTNGTVLTNKTYSSGVVRHVGQLFFPMALREAVEATAPYSTNLQAVTTNAEDMWAPDEADNDYDPFPSFAYLGSSIEDGLLMWISIGLDTSAVYTPDAAGELTADGGVASSSMSLGGGGSNTTSFNGTMSSNGTMPTNGTMLTNGTAPIR